MISQQLDFNRTIFPPRGDWTGDFLILDSQRYPVVYRRNDRATRYRLTVGRDGLPRNTIPRRGSRKAAEEFALRHRDWVLKQIAHREEQRRQLVWNCGTIVLLRGQPNPLEVQKIDSAWFALLGLERFPISSPQANIRAEVELQLQRLAGQELPPRVIFLAATLKSRLRKIVVRAQVSRWGSCSCRRTISLNWRLIQVPPEVRDYVIIHELVHLREMSHSSRFWTLVAEACPGYKKHEAWLRKHSQALL